MKNDDKVKAILILSFMGAVTFAIWFSNLFAGVFILIIILIILLHEK